MDPNDYNLIGKLYEEIAIRSRAHQDLREEISRLAARLSKAEAENLALLVEHRSHFPRLLQLASDLEEKYLLSFCRCRDVENSSHANNPLGNSIKRHWNDAYALDAMDATTSTFSSEEVRKRILEENDHSRTPASVTADTISLLEKHIKHLHDDALIAATAGEPDAAANAALTTNIKKLEQIIKVKDVLAAEFKKPNDATILALTGKIRDLKHAHRIKDAEVTNTADTNAGE
ncbi:hypothetical protein FB567DRAFT_598425 [Paraphoma chrysanthemicola]|uniref:Uncharacterized protein n=1 Tax=Paraphoma chrysanthemicola TaxID=798071 RepID=A0A8K0QUL4_9PLEO|nr:hypothetical protein FB567DRAFT_598425 [Paraphoma chrysanthemicola]